MISCSQHYKNKDTNENLFTLYILAQKDLGDNNLQAAISSLEKLHQCYPGGSYFYQIKLDLIYAYYKNSDMASAKKIIEDFKRLYPLHPNIDYIMYMEGVINMQLDKDLLYNFGMIFNERNAIYAYNALKIFSDLLKNYKDSYYLPDAYKRLIYLKNRLAAYELNHVKFYFDRGAYIAVINRVKNMMQYYPETKSTLIALTMMQDAYKALNLYHEAKKTEEIIALNEK